MARGLLRSGGFTLFTPQGRPAPSAYQPPLYPTFMAGVFRLLGDARVAFIAVQLIQCLLGCLIVLMTFWLATRFLECDYALLAGVLACFWPAFAYMPNEAHPISCLVAVLLWVTTLTVDVLRDGPTVRRCVWLGAALALSVLIRSEVLPGAVLIPLLLWWRTRSAAPLAALAIGLAVEGAWVAHNSLFLGRPVLTTTLGLNLYRGNGPTATGGSYEWNGEIVWDTPATVAGTAALPWSRDYEVRRDGVYTAELERSLRSDPLRPMRLLPAKFFYFWTADFTHPKGRSPLAWVPWMVLLPFTVTGMWALLKRPGSWPLFFWCAYYLLVVLALFALPRYRMGVEPMFLIFAVAGMRRWRAGGQ